MKTNKELLTYILSHIHMHGTDDLMEFRTVLEALPTVFHKAELYDESEKYQEYKKSIEITEFSK